MSNEELENELASIDAELNADNNAQLED